MIKFYEKIRPFLLFVLGSFLFLTFLNPITDPNEAGPFTLAIIAIVVSLFYEAFGVVSIILGEKISPFIRRILDVVAIGLFPAFMFGYFLVNTIVYKSMMGPAGWIINISSMISSILVIVAYALASFMKIKLVARLGQLFASIFVLTLLVDLLFDVTGGPNAGGFVLIPLLVLYIAYSALLLFGATSLKDDASSKAEELSEE